jgi:hypothetical protein
MIKGTLPHDPIEGGARKRCVKPPEASFIATRVDHSAHLFYLEGPLLITRPPVFLTHSYLFSHFNLLRHEPIFAAALFRFLLGLIGGIAALARQPSCRFADFREIWVHTCLCLKLVERRAV